MKLKKKKRIKRSFNFPGQIHLYSEIVSLVESVALYVSNRSRSWVNLDIRGALLCTNGEPRATIVTGASNCGGKLGLDLASLMKNTVTVI